MDTLIHRWTDPGQTQGHEISLLTFGQWSRLTDSCTQQDEDKITKLRLKLNS